MHHNIPSDKIMFFGLLAAVTIVAFFLVAKLKNAGWGGRVLLSTIIVALIGIGAAIYADYNDLIAGFDFIPWF